MVHANLGIRGQGMLAIAGTEIAPKTIESCPYEHDAYVGTTALVWTSLSCLQKKDWFQGDQSSSSSYLVTKSPEHRVQL